MKNILPSLLLLFLLILLDVDDGHGRRLRGLHDLLSLEAKKTLFNTFAKARGSSVYLQRFTWPAPLSRSKNWDLFMFWFSFSRPKHSWQKTRENEESANLTWKLWKKLENMTVNILGKWSLKLCGAPPHDLKSFGGKLKAKWVIWKEWASANHLAKLAPLMHCLTLPKRLAGPILMDHHESQGATFSAEKKGSLPGIILKFVA